MIRAKADAAGFPATVTIEGILDLLPSPPVMSTRNRGWEGMTIDVMGAMTLHEFQVPVHDHHLVCYCPSGGSRFIQARAGAVHERLFCAGMTLIMPAGYASSWHGPIPPLVSLRIRAGLLEEVARQAGLGVFERFELRNIFETRDQTIERIVLGVKTELERPAHPAQRLIAESLSWAFVAHLLRSYNAFDFPEGSPAPILNDRQLQKLREYIHERITSPIGLDDLARVLGISKFHFARVFKRSTGMTALRYVEQCRIDRAISLIAHSDVPLADIALQAGFADQSHFTRRFCQHVGCTPGAYARGSGRRRRKAV